MSWRNIGTVYRKELRDSLRDRRTVISMIVVPVLLMPLLTIVTTSTVWIVDLARPNPQHSHAGAVLQATNDVATPQQVAAAAELYSVTKAAILPYEDWHKALAAGS